MSGVKVRAVVRACLCVADCRLTAQGTHTGVRGQLSAGLTFHTETGSFVYQTSWPMSLWGFSCTLLHPTVGALELNLCGFWRSDLRSPWAGIVPPCSVFFEMKSYSVVQPGWESIM